jgi:hypothetical protein
VAPGILDRNTSRIKISVCILPPPSRGPQIRTPLPGGSARSRRLPLEPRLLEFLTEKPVTATQLHVSGDPRVGGRHRHGAFRTVRVSAPKVNMNASTPRRAATWASTASAHRCVTYQGTVRLDGAKPWMPKAAILSSPASHARGLPHNARHREGEHERAYTPETSGSLALDRVSSVTTAGSSRRSSRPVLHSSNRVAVTARGIGDQALVIAFADPLNAQVRPGRPQATDAGVPCCPTCPPPIRPYLIFYCKCEQYN